MKIVTAAEAVAGIRSHENVYVHAGAATPSVLLDAMVGRSDGLEDVKVVHFHIEGPGPHLAPEMAGHFFHRALFIGPNARAAVNEGRAEYIPVFLSDAAALIRRGTIPVDTVLINVSPPDAHGFCSHGHVGDRPAHSNSCRARPSSLRSTARCRGRWATASSTSTRSILASRSTSRPMRTHFRPSATSSGASASTWRSWFPTARRIQMGIGAIPSAVADALRDKRDLGIHTEMMTDVVLDLVERGVVTGRAKEINRGRVVATFMLGSQRLYDWVDDNPMVEMRPADYTNDTRGHPSLQEDGGDQLRHRDRSDRPGVRRLDRLADVQRRRRPDGLHPRRGAGRRGPGNHRPALDCRARQRVAHRAVSAARAPEWSRRARTSRPSSPSGAWPSCTAVQIRERARRLIAIADPRFRDELEAEAGKASFI